MENTTREDDKSSIIDVMDNPIVIRIMATLRKETQDKVDSTKNELLADFQKKEEEQRNNHFRLILKMFKALRSKSKDDYLKEKQGLEIRVADLETQGLLESEPTTAHKKNTEMESALEFISGEYDHLLPWIKQTDSDTEHIGKRVDDLEKKNG